MKNKIKILLGSLATVGLVGAITPLLVSCGTSGNPRVEVKTKSFDVVQKSKKRTINEPTELMVYDANKNENANQQLQEIRNNLSPRELQADFNRVLIDFYECYEQETGKSEIEIDNIQVIKKNDNGSFTLKVTYELEIDTLESNKRDLEVKKTKEIEWTPKFVFLTEKDEAAIKKQVISYNGEQNGMDLSDLKELFFGEKEDDPLEDDFDDYGIFDRLRMINKQNDGYGSMVAYELSVADIFDKLGVTRQKPTITKDTKFRIPSISLNGGSLVLVPNIKPRIGSDFKEFKTSELDTMFAEDKRIITDSDIKKELKKLFVKPIDDEALKIQEIKYFRATIDEHGIKEYKVHIIYQNTINEETYYSCDILFITPSDQQLPNA